MTIKTNNYLESYFEGIKSKKYIVGLELREVIEQLINDMNSSLFYYNTSEVDKRIDLIENVLRLTKAPFYNHPFRLLDWQKAFLSAFYSFYTPDGKSRFWKSLLMIGRKNGKSGLVSGLINAEFLIGEAGSDICISSDTDKSSSIIYDEIDQTRLLYDPKSIDTIRNLKGIKNLINGSKIYKLSESNRGTLDGRSIAFSCCDECHSFVTNSLVKTMEMSMSTQNNKKMIMITTNGFINNGFLDNELEFARKVINKEISADYYLPWLYTQDSENEVFIGNEENRLWEKSNPSLGVIKKYEYLQQQVNVARESKTDRVYTLTKDFNIKQTSSTAWLNLEDYNYNATFDINEFQNYIAFGACDLSETLDLTCAGIVLINENDKKKKYVYTHYFIPESKLLKAPDINSGAKYNEWIEYGLITVYQDSYLDTSIIADWFFELYEKYKIKTYKIGYDTRFANQFIQKAENYGFETEIIYQRPEVLSAPIKKTELELQCRNIVGLSEIDKWCLGNCCLSVNSKGLGLLEKIRGQSGRRKDGADVLVFLIEMLERHKQEILR